MAQQPLTRLLAPLLPVTADELWKHLPGERESVHLSDFPTGTDILVDQELLDRWTRLLAIRETVNSELERLRKEKAVGTSLSAGVPLYASGETANLLDRYKNILPTLFITSDVIVSTEDIVESEKSKTAIWNEINGAVTIQVYPAKGVKCPRCWRYVPSIPQVENEQKAGLCRRCLNALPETVCVS